MNKDEKQTELIDWIKNLDEEALDQLLVEFCDYDLDDFEHN